MVTKTTSADSVSLLRTQAPSPGAVLRVLVCGMRSSTHVTLFHEARAKLEPKRRLLAIMPAVQCRVWDLDHPAERGRDLFRVACEQDSRGLSGTGGSGEVARTCHGA